MFLGDDMYTCPEKQSEATERIELSTLGLQDQCSTTELSSQLYWKQSVELCGQLGRVAQSVERRSDKAKVLGSSPSMTRPTFSLLLHQHPCPGGPEQIGQTCLVLSCVAAELQQKVPLVGLEPTIFGLGSQRLIH